jgi:hypothetical protein
MENYDPCGKYVLIYKVMVHNMNYVMKRADSDGTMDESSGGLEVTWQSAVVVKLGKRCLKEDRQLFGWIFTDAILGRTSIDTSCKLQQHIQMGSVTRDKQKW